MSVPLEAFSLREENFTVTYTRKCSMNIVEKYEHSLVKG